MTLRQRIENVPRWPSVATTADLPNVSGALTQSSSLEHGDTCYVTSRSGLYLCTDAALGAAAWTPVGGGYGLLPNAPTVAALYHFDNSTVDVSGNGRNLAVSGSPSYEIGPRDRRAILSDNLTILSATDAVFGPSGASGSMALEVVVRISDITTWAQIAGNTTAFYTDPNYSLRTNSAGLYFVSVLVDGGPGEVEFYLGWRLPLDDFHHVVINRTVAGGSTTVDWYVDGAFRTTQTSLGQPSGYSGNTLAVLNSIAGNAALQTPNALSALAFHTAPLTAAEILDRARVVLAPGMAP